ncbi:GNAT family N-acetyltransferase [Streptomyces sp. SP17BM10]|uniref:GNAT family N-acetyltransferase n=1 Tax=Streptomyces sp. SP17BM10 TaxID=3002530 RepID=UPI002E787DF1|nr:GNAT family N-acetyltransferase [Streptomyces sp. SP17BM10]MEE1786169.1 GNAT family N-acetyltransferase [Streptomyces sp. SP17BM10]
MVIAIRPFRSDDAPQVAEIVRRCLREVNSQDYPVEVIDRMCGHFTAARFVELSAGRDIYIADEGGVVGTVSRDGNKVHSMFVDPDAAGRGIGRLLMDHVEALAAADGHEHMEAGASITAHRFYLRRGYQDVRESESGFGLTYLVRKPLRPSAA